MDIYEAIAARRTIREFEDIAIEDDTLERILDAGLKAPTNDHMRNWEFVVISDKNVRAQMVELIPKTVSREQIDEILAAWNLKDEGQRRMYYDAIPKQYAMLYNAGALVLPFFKQEHPLLAPKAINDLNGFASMWCCIENILLAAASEGIFGVTRIPFSNELEKVRTVIGHPQNYVLPCYLALGYPKKGAVINEQYHFAAKDRIRRNHW
ncbi:nitroreductase family protein [Acetanaerobacterium elongatum]|uniref:Nitroreductase n=1 Tax=Acetanaerobacterium elongatum TaxID=258515 RepID=A0A1H0BZ20_9FIRM|nr:nitroreductase family protein [Acetanaerobacterium elongatum]SDN50874.1 Nitroreductase [Acetanaerobacterium elongatum]